MLGHFVFAGLAKRCILSIMRAVYSFVSQSYLIRQTAWPSVCYECWLMACMLPLACAELSLPWASEVTATDASTNGSGVCSRDACPKQIQNIAKWSERWRFKRLDPDEWKPRSRTVTLDESISDPTTVKNLSEVGPDNEWVERKGFPEVPQGFLQGHKWKTLYAGRFLYKEPITILEGRSLLWKLRFDAKNSLNHGSKRLYLVDNFGLALSMGRGRAVNYSVLQLCRRSAALQLFAGIDAHFRWIPSEWNVADAPSRRYAARACPQLGTTGPHKNWEDHLLEAKAEWKEQLGEGSGSKKDNGPTTAATGGPASHARRPLAMRASHGERCSSSGVRARLPRVPLVLPDDPQCVAPCFARRRPAPASHSRLHRPHRGRRLRRSSCAKSSLSDQGVDPCADRDEVASTSASSFKRSGQVTSPVIASPLSLRTDVRDCNSSDVAGRDRDGVLCLAALLQLPEARRSPQDKDEGLQSSCEAGLESDQGDPASLIVWDNGSAVRGPCGVEESNLRRSHHIGSSSLVRSRLGEIHGESLPSRKYVHHESGGPGCHLEGCASSSRQHARSCALPVATRGRGRRPCNAQARHALDLSPPQALDPAKHETIREERPSCKIVVCSLAKNSKVLRVGGRQPASSDGRHAKARPTLITPGAGVLEEPEGDGPLLFEVFAGTGRTAAAWRALGGRAKTFEINDDPAEDVLRPRVSKMIFEKVRRRVLAGLFLGMPCSTWSMARRGPLDWRERLAKGERCWPGPLRGDFGKKLWGLPGMTPGDQLKVRTANNILRWCLKILHACRKFGVPAALENPLTSRVWKVPGMMLFCQLPGVKCVDLDACQFGSSSKKPTRIVYVHCDLSGLNKRCRLVEGKCSASGCPHVSLEGCVDKQFRTAGAAAYEWPLAEALAWGLKVGKIVNPPSLRLPTQSS